MENIDLILKMIKEYVWGAPLLIFLIGTGAYLTFILKGVQFRYLGYAIRQVFAKQKAESSGDISQFEALMTSLAGAIGTGNIVGVTTAITVGGYGSLFWMWVTAFITMSTKYAENLLAVKYREKDSRGEMIGGPMEYIEKGLGLKWMAILFAILGLIACIGTGNLVQVNAIVEAVCCKFILLDPLILGVVISVLTGLVVIGGVKSIGHVAGVMVPLMALFYIGGGLTILVMNISHLPAALQLIFESAFTGQAAVGGFTGASVMMAIQLGVSRSVFTNEAGLGITAIAAAAAKTDAPARQALITMTGALLSTVIVCTITGLVVAVTGVLGQTTESGALMNGATLAISAFESALFGGGVIVSIGLVLFAFSTVVAWAYYGEKCFEYLFGARYVYFFRFLYTLIVIPGAVMKLELAWYFADIANGLMVIPNLIALIALSGVIVSETNSFLKRVEAGEL